MANAMRVYVVGITTIVRILWQDVHDVITVFLCIARKHKAQYSCVCPKYVTSYYAT